MGSNCSRMSGSDVFRRTCRCSDNIRSYLKRRLFRKRDRTWKWRRRRSGRVFRATATSHMIRTVPSRSPQAQWCHYGPAGQSNHRIASDCDLNPSRERGTPEQDLQQTIATAIGSEGFVAKGEPGALRSIRIHPLCTSLHAPSNLVLHPSPHLENWIPSQEPRRSSRGRHLGHRSLTVDRVSVEVGVDSRRERSPSSRPST